MSYVEDLPREEDRGTLSGSTIQILVATRDLISKEGDDRQTIFLAV